MGLPTVAACGWEADGSELVCVGGKPLNGYRLSAIGCRPESHWCVWPKAEGRKPMATCRKPLAVGYRSHPAVEAMPRRFFCARRGRMDLGEMTAVVARGCA